MAVVVIKSTTITNRDASPVVLSNSNIKNARMREFVGTIETNGDDSTGATYIFGTLPSNARVSQILLSVDGNNTGGTLNVGLYRTTVDGSAVVDADLFASAQALGTILTDSNITHESGVFGIEDLEKPLWEALGLSADPNLDYDLVGTIVTADDAADTISVKCRFVV